MEIRSRERRRKKKKCCELIFLLSKCFFCFFFPSLLSKKNKKTTNKQKSPGLNGNLCLDLIQGDRNVLRVPRRFHAPGTRGGTDEPFHVGPRPAKSVMFSSVSVGGLNVTNAGGLVDVLQMPR